MRTAEDEGSESEPEGAAATRGVAATVAWRGVGAAAAKSNLEACDECAVRGLAVAGVAGGLGEL